MSQQPLLEVKDLKTHFYTKKGRVTAVDGVSFNVNEGEILGVVGESGCGKSVTLQSILRLFDERHVAKHEGEVNFEGKNLLKFKNSQMQRVRGNDISMIFQDAASSLDPVYTIGFQISEALRLHRNISKREAYQKAIHMLELTGIPAPEKRINEYPHQLSGGMQQRVMIAIGLACQPKLLIADEPTTALDVTIQAQILDLILNLNKEINMGVVFVTHDLGVISEICTRVVIMYLGQIVEISDVKDLFNNPLHPYTQGLIKSIPQLKGDRNEKLHVIEGVVPSLNNVPKGCRFASRCPFADDLCRQEEPNLQEDKEGRWVRCWHYKEIASYKEDRHVTTN